MSFNNLKEMFDAIEETIQSPEIRIDLYKSIIKNLVLDGDSMGYVRYMVKERLKAFKTDPQFSFNSEGGYE